MNNDYELDNLPASFDSDIWEQWNFERKLDQSPRIEKMRIGRRYPEEPKNWDNSDKIRAFEEIMRFIHATNRASIGTIFSSIQQENNEIAEAWNQRNFNQIQNNYQKNNCSFNTDDNYYQHLDNYFQFNQNRMNLYNQQNNNTFNQQINPSQFNYSNQNNYQQPQNQNAYWFNQNNTNNNWGQNQNNDFNWGQINNNNNFNNNNNNYFVPNFGFQEQNQNSLNNPNHNGYNYTDVTNNNNYDFRGFQEYGNYHQQQAFGYQNQNNNQNYYF